MKRMIPILALCMLGACTESTSNKEKQEIEVMDSTEKAVKRTVDDLEDQTEKVERSLEKLEKEFEDTTD
ncbi:MAG TPA: hypothetical protein VEB63_03285 [Chitinophagaceae bacterium]|nr:hypothetical protein [Chitinophagaceae bacterium]